MSIPDFIRTKWKSKGATDIQISDLGCEECQKEWYTYFENENKEQQSNSTDKCSIHSKYITCYISALHVWEYKGRNHLLEKEAPSEVDSALEGSESEEDFIESEFFKTDEEIDSVMGMQYNNEKKKSSFGWISAQFGLEEISVEEEISVNKVSENSKPDLGSTSLIMDTNYREPWYIIFSPFWWFGYCLEKDFVIDQYMKKAEQESLDHFEDAFNPVAKKKSDFFSSKSLYITKVKNIDDGRVSFDNLVKIEVKANKESETSSEIIINFMSEEDIDKEIEHIYKFNKFTPDENLTACNKDVAKKIDDNSLTSLKAEKIEDESCCASKFDDYLHSEIDCNEDNNQMVAPLSYKNPELLHEKMRQIVRNYNFIQFSTEDDVSFENMPPDLPEELTKYWIQRYRLFLRYDDIKLDYESWFSVTPEMVAEHQAYRCACDTVVDAFCGAGSNTIQLALTCNHVIAIDIDPKVIEIARHNAHVYGVEDRIKFIQGDFFQLASSLKADAVMLSPPWGGVNYDKETYDVFTLGGTMNCKLLIETARKVSEDIALYLPKSSNLLQVIELAGANGKVDIEFHYISTKKKAITAYYGSLAECFVENSSL
ncbi:UNVERIFIED_CONTAM: hypothetical protein RMT77_008509 [Armadillidium vulgare]